MGLVQGQAAALQNFSTVAEGLDGLHYLKGLFQSRWFCDSMKCCKTVKCIKVHSSCWLLQFYLYNPVFPVHSFPGMETAMAVFFEHFFFPAFFYNLVGKCSFSVKTLVVSSDYIEISIYLLYLYISMDRDLSIKSKDRSCMKQAYLYFTFTI